MLRIRVLLMFFFLAINLLHAQDSGRVLFYEHRIAQAGNDADKISAYADLADYYAVFMLNSSADSLLQKALLLAEVSSDKDLILKILFNNTITRSTAWSSKTTIERSRNFIQKGLQYSQELNRQDYVALAYIRLAGLSRKSHLYNDAIQQTNQAFTALADSDADSLKCVLYNELGDIYLANNDAVSAYRNYNNAFHISYSRKLLPLLSDIYHRFAELYRSFGDVETAKSYLLQSLTLNLTNNFIQGQFKDYIDLARITNDRGFIDTASIVAKRMQSDRAALEAKKLLYYWYMVEGKNSAQTFQYLSVNPELVQIIRNSGSATYNWEVGNIYHYASQNDSALIYYKMAEGQIAASYELGPKLDICSMMAEAYLANRDSDNAKKYYEQAFMLGKQLNRTNLLPGVCSQLGVLSSRSSDFRMAYFYAIQADSVNRILQANSAKDKVILLQVDRENKKTENDILEAEREKSRKNNLQIMAITLVLMLLFALMLFMGMFEVSKTSIKMLGYFTFISLFEFIILLLEHPIEHITGGEPVKVWLIKIVLIALLVPCQHFLEHGMIRFLQSRHLAEVRQRMSMKKWFFKMKKPEKPDQGSGIDDIENDTALL